MTRSVRHHVASATVQIKPVLVYKDEASLRARRKYTQRGTATLKQIEHMWLISRGALVLPERDGCIGGTNKGQVIGPIRSTSIEADWKATKKDSICGVFGFNFYVLSCVCSLVFVCSLVLSKADARRCTL